MVSQKQLQPGEGHISRKVVEAVARKEGVSPVEVNPPLYEVVDPDALDQFFEDSAIAGRMEGTVAFTYDGYEVSVHGDDDISVDVREIEHDERNLF
ncbi:MAG: HalOD1 output domain-containing protein [Haloarculaceae archaeon]